MFILPSLLGGVTIIIFLTPATFAGTNHVLPTGGTAKFSSPLSVDDFVKKSSYIYYSKAALERDGEKIMSIAAEEGLMAHRNSIKVRWANEGDK